MVITKVDRENNENISQKIYHKYLTIISNNIVDILGCTIIYQLKPLKTYIRQINMYVNIL